MARSASHEQLDDAFGARREMGESRRAIGETVALLAMLDSFVPQPKAARRTEHDVQLLQLFVENNFGGVDVPWRLLQRLDHDALLDEVIKALGGAVTPTLSYRSTAISAAASGAGRVR